MIHSSPLTRIKVSWVPVHSSYPFQRPCAGISATSHRRNCTCAREPTISACYSKGSTYHLSGIMEANVPNARQILQTVHTMPGFALRGQRNIDGVGFVRVLATLLTGHLDFFLPMIQTSIEESLEASFAKNARTDGDPIRSRFVSHAEN